MQYSPLCDTDIRAYFAYLLASSCRNGPIVERVSERDGGDNSNTGCCGVDCYGEFVTRLCSGLRVAAGVKCDELGDSVAVGGCSCDFGRVVGTERGGGSRADVGLAGGHDCSGVCCMDRGVSVGQCGHVESTDGKSETARVDRVEPVVSEVNAVGVGCLPGESKYDRNRRWAVERKERKRRRKVDMSRDWRRVRGSVIGGVEPRVAVDKLHDSSVGKWRAQNDLAKFKAERELEVLRSSDVELEKRRYRTRVNAHVEKNMVSIERTHALLSVTGNVPGVFHGSAETIVDGVPSLSSGSISPDSSASQSEFRAAQKVILDQEDKIARMNGAFEKLGLTFEAADAADRRTFTDDSEGNALLDMLHPDATGYFVMRDGKKKFRLGMDEGCLI